LENKNTVQFEVIERKVTFFIELCAVFGENLSCHLAEETKFFVVGIQTT